MLATVHPPRLGFLSFPTSMPHYHPILLHPLVLPPLQCPRPLGLQSVFPPLSPFILPLFCGSSSPSSSRLASSTSSYHFLILVHFPILPLHPTVMSLPLC